jgi:hypothetical protein
MCSTGWSIGFCLKSARACTHKQALRHEAGEVMRYLWLMMLVSIFGLSTPAFAQMCCPAGCVNDYNPRVA